MEELRGRMPEVRRVDADIRHAEFIKSSYEVDQCPPTKGMPEVALIGMSNCGKSSLINCLTQLDIARVSTHPGRTRCINHFLCNGRWYLVDLPGYGKANAPKSVRDAWGKFTIDYFLNRRNLCHVLLLVDATQAADNLDLLCVNWLAEHGIPFTVVFTKVDLIEDRLSVEVNPHVQLFMEHVRKDWNVLPFWFETSSTTGLGQDELLHHLAQVRKLYLEEARSL